MEEKMPGSYPDPHMYADTAINALERAYKENKHSHTGSLILTALDAIMRLKQDIRNASGSEHVADSDPFETGEYYRAT